MALIADYFDKTQKYIDEYGEKTIILMQVGAFFEVYGLQHSETKEITGSEIIHFSQICDLNVVEKKAHLNSFEIVMAGFKDMYIEKYVKRLQDAGFTAVVFVQDEQAKDTTRSLYEIYSPGTYFNEDITKITNNIMCIWFSVIEHKTLFNNLKQGRSSSLLNKTTVNNNLHNFKINKIIYVGIANIDIYTGETSIFEFNEQYINNPTTFDELERVVSIYNPSETLLIGNITEKEMNDIINYTNIQSSLIHKIYTLNDDKNIQKKQKERVLNCEKQIYQRAVLEKFYKIHDIDSFMVNFYNNTIATQAFCYLLDFIYQHNPNLVNKIHEPKFENGKNMLILANHSLKQLNIIDDNTYSGNYSSVVKMLNSSITSMGKRKFAYNLLNPTTSVDVLNNEYDITEYLINKISSKFDSCAIINKQQSTISSSLSSSLTSSITCYEYMKQQLFQIKDIAKWMRQIVMKKISPKSLSMLSNNISVIINMCEYIQTDENILKYLKGHKINCENIVNNCQEILIFLKTNMNLEQAKSIDTFQKFDTNFINRNIDELLDNKIQTLMESNDKLEACQNYFNKLLFEHEKNSKTTEYVKIHETEKTNFSLVTTKRRSKILKTVIQDIESRSGSQNSTHNSIKLDYKSSFNNNDCSFLFNLNIETYESTAANDCITNAQIKEICKNLSLIKIELKDIISSVYLQIIESFTKYLVVLDEINNFVATIDVVYAKAFIAKKYNYCKPTIKNESDKSFCNVTGLRHCIIEQLNQNELYVTNDIKLGKDTDGILLYGTNAVGKTSLIRALGIAVIMAQSGLYVPAESFLYKPYNYLFTRIIGNDNIFKGLSTFAVEMSELRTILRLSNENSLILGDELCSGTESISATSIFVAGIQSLYSKQSSFIFATHLHEIINYDEILNMPKLSLKHMEVVYDKSNDILMYDRKLKDGPGQSMYGLEVCKSLNLPEDFLSNAYNIRIKYNPECVSMLSSKRTHFNNNKIKSAICENCGNMAGVEVHHLQHQKAANDDNIIIRDGMTFHKDHKANLITLCEKCHHIFHDSNKQHKKVKTTKGYILKDL